MLGFKAFDLAARISADIETIHMTKKGQFRCPDGLTMSAADHLKQPRLALAGRPSSFCSRLRTYGDRAFWLRSNASFSARSLR
jgi:hypothetical protein